MFDYTLSDSHPRDLVSDCLQHMETHGLRPEKPLVVNSTWQRYSVEGKKNDKPEWYIASENTFSQSHRYLCCVYGSFKTGVKHTFFSGGQETSVWTDEQRRQMDEDMARIKREAQEQQNQQWNTVAQEANKVWEGSAVKPSDSRYDAYLVAKGIEPIGGRFNLNPQKHPALVLPLTNIDAEIRSLQFISRSVDGTTYKTFLAGGQTKGNFLLIGELRNGDPIVVCEGYATGVSVYQAIDQTVVIAFSAGNLEPVIASLFKKCPDSKIIIAADCDESGRKKAAEATIKHGCSVVFPEFSEDLEADINGKKYTDFNDLYKAAGLEEVSRQLNMELRKALYQEKEGSSPSIIIPRLMSPVSSIDSCAEFSLDPFPPILREYVRGIAERTNAHPIMVTMSVVCGLASLTQKRLWLPETEYFQKLYANIWAISIARSGGFKTTALNQGAEIALEKSQEIRTRIKDLRQKQPITTKAIQQEFEQLVLAESLKDPRLPDKVTTEGFLEHLAQGHSGVILASEFGAVLQNMSKNHNGDLKMLLTDLYDVPHSYRYKTKTQGDLILNEPCFSICGVSTLEWIRSNLLADDVASGFFARFLLFSPLQSDVIPPALPNRSVNYDRSAKKKIQDTLEFMEPFYSYQFSPSAKEAFERAHAGLYDMAAGYTERCQHIIAPYLKRWSPYILKLAMIMRLFEDPTSTELSESSIQAALAFLKPAMRSTAGLFEGELGESEHQRKCRTVYEWICKKTTDQKRVTRACLLTSRILEGGGKDYDYALQTLLESGKIGELKGKSKKEDLYFPIS